MRANLVLWSVTAILSGTRTQLLFRRMPALSRRRYPERQGAVADKLGGAVEQFGFAPARAAWVARCLSTFWRKCSATWGVLRARDKDSRARPTLAAASTIFLHSPDTMASIAARTFF